MMRLTRREAELMPLAGKGMTYDQIAHVLDLSPVTVRTYLHTLAQRIRSDLPTKTRVQVYWRMANNLSVFTGEPLDEPTSK